MGLSNPCVRAKKVKEPLTLGVDLGATKVKTALVDGNGEILLIYTYPTHPEKGPQGIIADLLTYIDRCLHKTRQEAQALGIGIAGQVDFKGLVHFAPNLNWRNVPLKKKLEKNLGVPVVAINDVRAATWGEWRFGSGRGVDNLVVLFVGTGIGGGVISGGNLMVGCSNTGGELGHITLVSGGRNCRCRNVGCLEAYAGGWAIAERAQDAVRADPKAGARIVFLAGSIEKITAATVNQAFRQGDHLARELVRETGQYLAAGVVGIVNAFNPCLVALGGGVIDGLPELVHIVKKVTRRRALKSAVENLKVVKVSLGDNAGVIGAADFAQSKIGGAS